MHGKYLASFDFDLRESHWLEFSHFDSLKPPQFPETDLEGNPALQVYRMPAEWEIHTMINFLVL
jgi:hypothetical protein